MNWNEIFEYRDGKIYWKVSPGRRAKVGSEAGSNQIKGYRFVKFHGVLYMTHRVIWEMHNCEIPHGMEVDHLNHIMDDNRIENLRVVTKSINQRNASKRIDNKSGFTGVYWYPKYSKWNAYATVNSKRFNLGYFESKQDAYVAVKKFRSINDFHKNHGVDLC